MKNIIKISVLIISLLVVSNANDIDVDGALSKAKVENKHILFFFHIKFCPYCKRMLEKNFKDNQTIAQIKKDFILVDVHTGQSGTVGYGNFNGTKKEFAKYIGATAFPATLFMDKDSKIVHKAIGYRNIEEFLTELKYVGTKSYKTTTLETFSENLEFEKDD